MRASILVFVLVCSTGACLAQDKVIISNDPPPPATRYPLVRRVGIAQVFYNDKRDETIARTKSLMVYGSDMEGLTLAAEIISKGKKIEEPKTVTLKIFYIGKDRTFLDDRTLKIILNGKELVSTTSKFVRANESNVILGSLEKEISFSDFTAISKSKNIQVQIGPATFVLSELAVQGFNDLMQTIER